MKTLVITGDGLNCERDTARAFELSGSEVDITHINDLLETPARLLDYKILAIPGGFSFGDEISSGQILALKMKYGLKNELEIFVKEGRLIIGICNGFQTLTKLGLLPKPFEPRTISLTQNKSKQFIDRWVGLETSENKCIWTKDISDIRLPIRHGEGRVYLKDESVYSKLKENGQVVFSYKEDVNGSHEKIAGLCDPTGRIFGLMPHPEAAINTILSPSGKRELKDGAGLQIFKNAVDFARENL
jgi:phosphoribosylformylglycinamidine synthase I